MLTPMAAAPRDLRAKIIHSMSDISCYRWSVTPEKRCGRAAIRRAARPRPALRHAGLEACTHKSGASDVGCWAKKADIAQLACAFLTPATPVLAIVALLFQRRLRFEEPRFDFTIPTSDWSRFPSTSL